MSESARGACFCGAVRVEVSGEPVFQGYCHCEDCRRWSGSPVTAFGLWPKDQVRVVAGEDNLVGYSRSGKAVRRHCAACGGAVMTDTVEIDMIDVYPLILEDFAFAPAFHIHYSERVIEMPDGVPKFLDLPADAGGSGEMAPA